MKFMIAFLPLKFLLKISVNFFSTEKLLRSLSEKP